MITVWHYLGMLAAIAAMFFTERFVRAFPHRRDPKPLTREKYNELFD